jgi:hypothetical protein
MTRAALLRSWLVTPPLGGLWSLAWAAVALPVASLLDWTMACPDVGGECCTPFYIFVLFTALLFGWRAGIVSALASLAAALWLDSLQPMQMHAPGADVWGSGLFLAISAGIIFSVELIRRTVARFARLSNPNEYSSGIIFSLEAGQAWASWPGQEVPVRLGPEQEVAAMMEDFLGQIATARRLGHWAGAAGA